MDGVHHAFHIDVDQLRPGVWRTVYHVTRKINSSVREQRVNSPAMLKGDVDHLLDGVERGDIASYWKGFDFFCQRLQLVKRTSDQYHPRTVGSEQLGGSFADTGTRSRYDNRFTSYAWGRHEFILPQ